MARARQLSTQRKHAFLEERGKPVPQVHRKDSGLDFPDMRNNEPNTLEFLER